MTVEQIAHERDRVHRSVTRALGPLIDMPLSARRLAALVEAYLRHVSPRDLAGRDAPTLAAVIDAHLRLAARRRPGQANVKVANLNTSPNGAGPARAMVQVVTDDIPFLVDSVSAELTRMGHVIHAVIHPQLVVERDSQGRLTGPISGLDPHLQDGPAEAWMHFEIDRIADATPRAELATGVSRVLDDVRAAVDDWQPMREQALAIAAELYTTPPPVPPDDVAEAREFLLWLVADHFTFLGYCDFSLAETRGVRALIPDKASALGTLRGDPGRPMPVTRRIEAVARQPSVLVLTKSTTRSTVHRPAHLDHVGIKRFDADGLAVGERRFVGLFTSSVYTQSVERIPLLRRKVWDVLRRSGLSKISHTGKDLAEILETYPRDELFQISIDELTSVAQGVLGLDERRQLRLFARHDHLGRFVSCLVFFPRDRYTTQVRLRLADILRTTYGATDVDHAARVAESVLARLHFTLWLPEGERREPVDLDELERRLASATRVWRDDLADALVARHGDARGAELAAKYADAFPEAYKDEVRVAVAIDDIDRLEAGAEGSIAAWVSESDGVLPGDRRLTIYRHGPAISLSQILPILERMRMEVIDERPYEVATGSSAGVWIYDFGLNYAIPDDLEVEQAHRLVEQTFVAVWSREAESDGFNALVPLAGLSWRQAAIMRAYARILRQSGSTFGQAYIEDTLAENIPVVRHLVRLFECRFDPAHAGDRAAAEAALTDELAPLLDAVASLDHDRILRSLHVLVAATDRTNHYQQTADGDPPPYLVLKIDPQRLDDFPRPRPRHEVWVQSPRVEAVHVRFGPVARGGLRWSDRREDLRTEVLDLAKTQAVKNAVIVPVGAKGGFIVKHAPEDPAAARQEGIACYQQFIGGMLDITDNIVDGEVVRPSDVVCHDGEDAYLVVAADKGTATFSDIANQVSVDHGYWLGDAFASGGSSGYDHKAMGITARGAWVSVERHLRELGIDPKRDTFTVAGIGDMSGDVFGNGMLLSRGIRLIAAFDHRHVFVDPDPDPKVSFRERRRLFRLARSSWADYDAAAISAGGGVFPRSAKRIGVSAQVAAALALGETAQALTPNDLIKAILRAPVDLLWNGGIGTFVKSAAERHADVGDKATDAIRVDASELRCRAVGEGGNLGFTQLGRVEYALGGGRINTDAVDNSAGVDTSDHEVNIKILLDRVVQSGGLTVDERNRCLVEMTDEVAEQVLRDNDGQNVALSHSSTQGPSLLHVHARMIRQFEEQGLLDREVESLPNVKQIADRRHEGHGLVGAELAVLMAYAKIGLADGLLASNLPDEAAFAGVLADYFPRLVRHRFGEFIPDHPLGRQIIATVVANQVVNRGGVTFWWRLRDELGASPADIARAHWASWEIFAMGDQWTRIAGLGRGVSQATRIAMRLEGERLVERGTRWLLTYRWAWRDTRAAIAAYHDGVRAVMSDLPRFLRGGDLTAFEHRAQAWVDAGVPARLAAEVAGIEAGYGVLDTVEVATERGRPVTEVAEIHYALAEELGIARLMGRINALPRDERWRTLARASLREDLAAAQAQLTANAVDHDATGSGQERVAAWRRTHRDAVEYALSVMDEIASTNVIDLSTMSVATRSLRGLVRAVTGGHF
jgi:glutamate dehydrogenase